MHSYKFMVCYNCNYGRHIRFRGEPVCRACPYQDYNCDTCLHIDKFVYEDPCRRCEDFSCYEENLIRSNKKGGD